MKSLILVANEAYMEAQERDSQSQPIRALTEYVPASQGTRPLWVPRTFSVIWRSNLTDLSAHQQRLLALCTTLHGLHSASAALSVDHIDDKYKKFLGKPIQLRPTDLSRAHVDQVLFRNQDLQLQIQKALRYCDEVDSMAYSRRNKHDWPSILCC